MTNCEKLLQKAQQSPNNFAFADLLKLAKCYRYTLRRVKGSHHIFIRVSPHDMLNIQPDKRNPSKAKPSQVRDVVDAILAETEGGQHGK